MSQRITSLFDLLDGTDVRDRIRQMIVDIGTVSEEETDAICVWVDLRLRSIRSSLQDVCFEDDMSEAEGMLPWIWLELRFEWMRYNAQMQYQTVMLGTASPELMARGAALSFLIEGVERQLDATQLYTVTRIAADPTGVALAAVSRTDRLFAVMAGASMGGRDAVESLLTAQEKIARITKGGPVRQEMTEAIGAVMQKVGDALSVTSEDFSHALQGVLLRELGQAPILVTLSESNANSGTQLPSAVAIGLLRAASEWMAAIRTTSLEVSGDERISLERPAFVTITWKLLNADEQVILELTDDADGTVSFAPNTSSWPVQDLVMSVQQEPGQGSTIHIRCDVTKLTEYLMLRVGPDVHDAMVCVPSLAVVHIEQRDAAALAVRGSRLINRLAGGTHPLVDLGDLLFDDSIDPDGATYVHVRYDSGGEDVLALRVRSVQGICRGSMKPVPASLKSAPIRGFVSTGQDIIAVLDIARALRHRKLPDDEAELVEEFAVIDG